MTKITSRFTPLIETRQCGEILKTSPHETTHLAPLCTPRNYRKPLSSFSSFASNMSGWNAYVDTQLVATGAVCQAGIFGKADMQCYANAGDFQVGFFVYKCVPNFNGGPTAVRCRPVYTAAVVIMTRDSFLYSWCSESERLLCDAKFRPR